MVSSDHPVAWHDSCGSGAGMVVSGSAWDHDVTWAYDSASEREYFVEVFDLVIVWWCTGPHSWVGVWVMVSESWAPGMWHVASVSFRGGMAFDVVSRKESCMSHKATALYLHHCG